MNSRVTTLIALCLLLLSCGTGRAEEYVWSFDRGADALHWKALNASPEVTAAGFSLVRRDEPFWFVSPQNLNISPGLSYAEFRLKAPETYLRGYLIVKTRDARSWDEEFTLGLPDTYHVYRINIQKDNKTGSPIDAIAFSFGGVDRVYIDYVKIYEPSPVQLIAVYWGEFWSVPFASPSTVNFIETPLIGDYPFVAPLYVLLLVVALCMVALHRPVARQSVVKSLILACVVAGLLFAFRMDYGWYMQWRADGSSLGQRSVDERISRVDGTGAYDFAQSLKRIVPPGATVRIYAGTLQGKAGILEGKVRYYLLPVKVSETARYIAVFKDPAVSYDPAKKSLSRNHEIVARDIELVTSLGKEGFLYRSSEGGHP
ncbi:MAG TPA: hypothetical protein VEM40_03515 [Nitrospirota bacterium]|nr:hypothetical protein [Nitrospirota bacterium]